MGPVRQVMPGFKPVRSAKKSPVPALQHIVPFTWYLNLADRQDETASFAFAFGHRQEGLGRIERPSWSAGCDRDRRAANKAVRDNRWRHERNDAWSTKLL